MCCETLTKTVCISCVAEKRIMNESQTEKPCVCAHVCVCVQGCLGRGPPYLSEARHGSRYLFLISPALCGFPAVTGLRVETGTNEQLHPACLPGIMGLQTDRASVCALFSALSFCHSLASPCSPYLYFLPFSGSIIFSSFFLSPGWQPILYF